MLNNIFKSAYLFQARVNAEVQAATLQRQRAIEEKKMKEMEKIREQLEKLLEEERQAKKDEEIVRTLQVTQPPPFDAILGLAVWQFFILHDKK